MDPHLNQQFSQIQLFNHMICGPSTPDFPGSKGFNLA